MDDLTAMALRAAHGDRGAVEAFIRATQVDVWRLCAHLGDRSEADDLAQETYVRALKSLPGFRGDSGVRPWLFAIARNVCADHVRSSTRRRFALRRQVQARTSEASVTNGMSDVWLDVQSLPEKLRTALVLTQVLGLSYAEAAEACSVPVGTIRSRVARAREALLADADAEFGS